MYDESTARMLQGEAARPVLVSLVPPPRELPAAMMLEDLLAQAPQSMSWVIDNVIAEGCVYIVAGAAKIARKTWLLMQTALVISAGAPWLGFGTASRLVIYAFLEDGHIRAAQRFRMLGAEAEQIGCVFSVEALTTEMEAAKRRGDKLFIVIDTLVNYEVQQKVKDENSSLDIERLIKGLRDYCRATGSTIVLSHHFGKGQQAMRGSSALNGSTDGWLDIEPVKEAENLFCAAPTLRDGEVSDIYYKVEHQDGRMRVERADAPDRRDAQEDAEPAATEKAREVFRSAPPEEGLTRKKIVEATGLSDAQVRPALEWLDDHGEIHRPNGPRSGYSRTENMRPPPRSLTTADFLLTPDTDGGQR